MTYIKLNNTPKDVQSSSFVPRNHDLKWSLTAIAPDIVLAPLETYKI